MMYYNFSLFTVLALTLQLLFGRVHAQDAPLWIQGAFEDASVADDSLYNSGGVIVVNGFSMNVPENLLVQFPAAWVPWKDLVASKEEFMGFETLVRFRRPISQTKTKPLGARADHTDTLHAILYFDGVY